MTKVEKNDIWLGIAGGVIAGLLSVMLGQAFSGPTLKHFLSSYNNALDTASQQQRQQR